MPEPPDPAKEMQQRYKNVFSTAEGRVVLGDILTLGHFGMIIDPASPQFEALVGERNLAITIAQMAGGFDSLYSELGMVKEN